MPMHYLSGHLTDESNYIHTLYRPFKNKVINDFVKNSRERFGVKTINRKRGGMLKILKVLKKNQTIAMLFDQNAGGAGTRMKFMEESVLLRHYQIFFMRDSSQRCYSFLPKKNRFLV